MPANTEGDKRGDKAPADDKVRDDDDDDDDDDISEKRL